MSTTNRLRRITDQLARAVCKHEGDILIDVDQDSSVTAVHLWVNQADMSACVGTRGATVRAFQDIIKSVGLQDGIETLFLLEEPRTGREETMPPFVPITSWNAEPTRRLVESVASEIFDAPCGVLPKVTGKISTTFQITVPAGTDTKQAEVVAQALNILMHAAGKSKHGRLLFVGLKIGDEPPQPANANGRYAPQAG
jgi:predicted RNA-binding protein YlqC (UPF0109 family)